MQYLGLTVLIFLLAELLSIIWVAKAIGGLAALCLIILCFMAGSFMMKRSSGLSKLMLAGGILHSGGRLSFYQMLYPIRVPLAAFLLMLPGFLSDFIALILLLPLGGIHANDAGETLYQQQPYRHQHTDDDDVIDGDFVVRPNRKQSDLGQK